MVSSEDNFFLARRPERSAVMHITVLRRPEPKRVDLVNGVAFNVPLAGGGRYTYRMRPGERLSHFARYVNEQAGWVTKVHDKPPHARLCALRCHSSHGATSHTCVRCTCAVVLCAQRLCTGEHCGARGERRRLSVVEWLCSQQEAAASTNAGRKGCWPVCTRRAVGQDLTRGAAACQASHAPIAHGRHGDRERRAKSDARAQAVASRTRWCVTSALSGA